MDVMNGTDILAALRDKAEALQAHLLEKVEANLSGDVLQSRSGALKESIVADLRVDAGGLAVAVQSRGVPYAAIQEHGGRTAPHDVLPVKAHALAFAGAGGLTFARAVHHPGSSIRARPYLGSALVALHDDIVFGLKAAVLDALA